MDAYRDDRNPWHWQPSLTQALPGMSIPDPKMAMRQATLLWLRCAPRLTWERDVSVIGPQRLLQGPLAHRQSDELAQFKQLVQGGIDARAGRLDQHR